MNPKRPTPRHLIIKMAKLKSKQRNLKTAREKQEVTYKGAPIKLAAGFSREMLQVRREWQEIFQIMKTRGLQPRLLYPARLSVKIEGQIKSFPDKSKRIQLHQTSSARDAKGTALRKGRKRERERNTGRNKGNE